ncbi:FmdB family zinc ribbon protein [Chloroflexota bacterium]
MPIYEYVCAYCGLKFEQFRPLNRASESFLCPHCHKTAERVMSSFCSFSKDESGLATSIGGDSCGSCGGGTCGTCGH